MLKIRDLIKIYPGSVTALKGINLDVHNGMFGLLGPNGAGKTTLMRIIAGILEPSSGTVHLDDRDIIADPDEVWSKLGYLPQEFGFYPQLTGEDMLIYLLKLKGIRPEGNVKNYARDLLERVNLGHAARRKIKGYSGGMRQRLGIAQAIAGEPRIIIVDEPTAGLDPEERLRFYRLLTELAENRIVLLSTHIVEDVSVLCPHFAVIRRGELVKLTSPSDAVGEIETAIYEGMVPVEEMEVFYREYCVTQSLLVEGRNRIRIYQPDHRVPGNFTSVKPSLEDAYLVLMKSKQDSPQTLPVTGNPQ